MRFAYLIVESARRNAIKSRCLQGTLTTADSLDSGGNVVSGVLAIALQFRTIAVCVFTTDESGQGRSRWQICRKNNKFSTAVSIRELLVFCLFVFVFFKLIIGRTFDVIEDGRTAGFDSVRHHRIVAFIFRRSRFRAGRSVAFLVQTTAGPLLPI